MSSTVLKLDDLVMNQDNKDVTINGQRDGLEAARGKAAVSIAGSGTFTLTAVQARWGVLELTGVLTGNRTVEVPTGFDHSLVVLNNTTGAFTVDFRWNGGTSVRIPRGSAVPVRKNGGAAAYDERSMTRLPEFIAERITSTQSVTPATDVVVQWNSEVLDPSESFNSSSTWDFTAPAPGLYEFHAQVEIEITALGVGDPTCSIALRKNGTVVRRGDRQAMRVTSAPTRSVGVSALLVLAQGDTVDVIVREEVAGSTVRVNHGSDKSYFQGRAIRLT